MLTGHELGAAIESARQLKGVTKKTLAEHFDVRPPSVQDWVKRGTIDKEKLPALWAYFADVVGLEHWGLAMAPGFSVDPPAITLAAALKQVGIALAVKMPADQRAELAEAMSAWVRYAGKERYRATVSELLAAPASPTQKRLAAR